jgi:hypothetical protein
MYFILLSFQTFKLSNFQNTDLLEFDCNFFYLIAKFIIFFIVKTTTLFHLFKTHISKVLFRTEYNTLYYIRLISGTLRA